MKKVLTLTLLILLLVLSGCKTTPTDPSSVSTGEVDSPTVEAEGIPLLIELRTSSTWSDLKILNPDLILSAEITSLIGEPSYFDLEDGNLIVEQSQEMAAKGEQVGLIISYLLDEKAASATLEFDLTKGCSNQSTVSIYGVVENEARLIYQRDLSETEDCGGLAFNMDMAGRLEALETIGSTGFAKDEIVFVPTDPATIQNGLEIEIITRSDGAWLVDNELPSYEILAVVGEPTQFGHGDDLVIDLGQPVPEAALGKWVGARIRLEIDPGDENQILDFTLHHGCINETILNFYKVVDGERYPIPNLDHKTSTTIFECADPLPIQVDLNQPQLLLRHYILENIHLDEGDLDAEGQIFLEAELVTNSDWAEILSDDNGVISTEMLSVRGDPTRVQVRRDIISVTQPTSSAGSAIEVGVTARYGFIPQGVDQTISFSLDNGCLNQATVRFYANLEGERIPIPVVGGQESVTAYGCEAVDFLLNVDTIRTAILAADSYDDLPLVATLSDIQGEVLVRQPGMEEFYLAREGGPLNVGGEILTGANAGVYLSLSDGSVLYLGPNSVFDLRFAVYSEELVLPRFGLQLGSLQVVSGSGGFLIYTPDNVIGAVGSAAVVNVSPTGEVESNCITGYCFEIDMSQAQPGEIQGFDEDGQATESNAGQENLPLDLIDLIVNRDGSVVAEIDSDGDGVPEDLDLCPDEGDLGNGIDALGCPTLIGSGDSDGDGVPDEEDTCVHLGDNGFGVDLSGCPLFYPDADLDGVPDWQDYCPDEGDSGNGVDERGCSFNLLTCGPGSQDWDGDGYLDCVDRCPTVYARRMIGSDDPLSNRLEFYGCPLYDYDYNGILDADECQDENCSDQDGDGVLDDVDLCPEISRFLADAFGVGSGTEGCPPGDYDHDGIPDLYECEDCVPPEESQEDGLCLDRDNDGICIGEDLCPFVTGISEYQGCPEPQDWDGDGVLDGEDLCPTIYAPSDRFGYSNANGCPDGDFDGDGVADHNECIPGEECLDRDGDGVNDAQDACPDIPWTPTDAKNEHSKDTEGCLRGDLDKDGVPDDLECVGCTPPAPYWNQGLCLDSDNDGVCNIDDLCPFKAGIGENQGCREGDSDGDGVRDGLDLCPTQGLSSFGVTLFGCPKTNPDQDRDGVEDLLDKCPTQGDLGQGVSSNGCPIALTDSDGDGYADSIDQCPQQGDQGRGINSVGCPIVVSDSDGDGVIDALDKCPNQGDRGDGLRNNGCPKTENNDPDGDGVIGALDHCPDQGENIDRNGCPRAENDPDGDGVLGTFDNCPNQGNQGYGVDRSGCPLDAPDSDGDGVVDNLDRCPSEGDQGFGLTSSGCPNPPPDSDGDGVNDLADSCPTEGNEGYGVNGRGCPNPPPNPDTDSDGVLNNVDACPNQGDQGYGINLRGCPNPAPDSDGDGVNDDRDQCPDQADQGYGVTNKGCPIPPPPPPVPDSDGDGVPDDKDACPNQGGGESGVGKDGCPLVN